jgi:hypothetical protein
MTLEEAQARILELTDQLADEKTKNETLSQDNDKLKKDSEDLRTLNQKYFNRLIAQEEAPGKSDGEEEEPEIPTCEEFARELLKKGF